MKIRDLVLHLYYKGDAVTLLLSEYEDEIEVGNWPIVTRVVNEFGPTYSLAGAGVPSDIQPTYTYRRESGEKLRIGGE